LYVKAICILILFLFTPTIPPIWQRVTTPRVYNCTMKIRALRPYFGAATGRRNTARGFPRRATKLRNQKSDVVIQAVTFRNSI